MGLSRMVPSMPVQSVDVGAEFYCRRLGFTPMMDSQSWFATMQRCICGRRSKIRGVSESASQRRRSAVALRLSSRERRVAGSRHDAVDKLYAEMSAARVLRPSDTGEGPTDTEWGTREFAVVDVYGNLLTFFSSSGS